MYDWLSVFVYSSVTVFVIVCGQPTIDDDNAGDNRLINTVASLRAELAKLKAKVAKLEVEKPHKSLNNCMSFAHFLLLLLTLTLWNANRRLKATSLIDLRFEVPKQSSTAELFSTV